VCVCVCVCAPLQYDSRFADAFWDSSKQTLLRHLLNLMTSWALVVDVWYLPPQHRRVSLSVSLSVSLCVSVCLCLYICLSGHSETTHGQTSALGDIFSAVSGMKLITITHYEVHMTLIAFSRSWFKGHRQHFLEIHFSGGDILIHSSLSKMIYKLISVHMI